MNQREVWGRRVLRIGFLLFAIGGIGGIITANTGYERAAIACAWIFIAGLLIPVLYVIGVRLYQLHLKLAGHH